MVDKPDAEDTTATDSSSEDINSEDVASTESVTESSQTQAGDETETAGAFAQRRIKKLSSDKKTLSQENEELRNRLARQAQIDEQTTRNNVPPAPSSFQSEEVDRAVNTLKERGFVTEDTLKDYLQQIDNRVTWDSKHSKNEAEVNKRGTGLPQYDRDEVEEYARDNGIADPLAAYRIMYFDEIVDSHKKKQPGKSVASQRPSKSPHSEGQPISGDDFRKRLMEDPEFYKELEADPQRFDAIMRELSQTE